MKRNFEEKSIRFIAYLITIAFIIGILIPIVFMLTNSFKDNKKVSDSSLSFFPAMSRSVTILVDYSQEKDMSEEKLKDLFLKDSIIALFSTIYELDNDAVFEIVFYAKMDDRYIFKMRAHRMKLQAYLDYAYFTESSASKKLLLSDNNYKKLSDLIGYTFDKEGINEEIPDADLIGKNSFDEKIGTFLYKNYGLSGKYIGTLLASNPLLMLENYIYYFEIPSALYKNIPIVKNFSFFAFLFNSILTISFGILAQIILCSSAAFSLSKLFPKRISNILLLFFLGIGMIPFISILVPQVLIFRSWGMYNNYAALLVPWLIPNGFSVFLFKGFFDRIPNSLFDSIRIDGASEWYSYSRLCMPLSKPIITLIAISTFLGGWNSFFWEWIVSESQNLWTLNVALYNISKVRIIKDNFLMGTSFVMILPVITVTLLLSEKIKQSIVSSGIKG